MSAKVADLKKRFHFDKEQLSWLEDALLVGLSEHGECERIRGYAEQMEACNRTVDPEFVPAHPTGNAQVISKFSTALSILRLAREIEEENA